MILKGGRTGEVWFEAVERPDLALLTEYIFTSERLSIQVHPNQAEARNRGLNKGKSECWYILDAEPGPTLGLGLSRELTPENRRAASLNGTIGGLMDRKPVEARDFFLVPPGTVHVIGPGISLLEFQQNADITYRLYDYGRPRELHLVMKLPSPSLVHTQANPCSGHRLGRRCSRTGLTSH